MKNQNETTLRPYNSILYLKTLRKFTWLCSSTLSVFFFEATCIQLKASLISVTALVG